MANYSYQSYSSGGGGGADAAFNAADANSDGRVDLGEFRNFLGMSFFFIAVCIVIDNIF
jgi:hypothetical protein